jgi:predicted unusual protein kinase regulating ubiquinone biosynthesis (AarF/ABC1/UbiB family)
MNHVCLHEGCGLVFPHKHHLITHQRTHRPTRGQRHGQEEAGAKEAGAQHGAQEQEQTGQGPVTDPQYLHRLVFLDAGIVSHFDEETSAHVVDIFEAMLTRQGKRAAEW